MSYSQFFDTLGSAIQYVSIKILDKFNKDVNWELYANLYKAGRISNNKKDALEKYFKQYI